MKRIILSLAVATTFMLASCGEEKKAEETATTEVSKDSTGMPMPPKDDAVSTESLYGPELPYTEAKGYFVKNTYKEGDLKDPKITTKEDFEKLFGMATTMGNDGKPTEIDFTKQNVIAVIGKVTDKPTTYSVTYLRHKDGTIYLNYYPEEGAATTSKMQPILLLIVDKKYDEKVNAGESKKV